VQSCSGQAERREEPVDIGEPASAHDRQRAANAFAQPLQQRQQIRLDLRCLGRLGDCHQGSVDVEEDRPAVARLRQWRGRPHAVVNA